MKKILLVFLLVSLLLFSACSDKGNNKNSLMAEEAASASSAEEASPAEEISENEENRGDAPAIEENSDSNEKSDIIPFEEPYPVTFLLNGEIDSNGIAEKANSLGLLKYSHTDDGEITNYSWNSVEELDVEYLFFNFDDILAVSGKEYLNQYRDYENPKNNEENPEERIVHVYQIPQDDYESYIQKYVDVNVETLRNIEAYDSSTRTYECVVVWSNGRGGGWPYEYETEQVSDNIYKISMINTVTYDTSMVEYIITVENNNDVPKYLSVENLV